MAMKSTAHRPNKAAEIGRVRARGVQPSRLAHGVPLGGELEYVDRGTLSHAFGSRSEIPVDPRGADNRS